LPKKGARERAENKNPRGLGGGGPLQRRGRPNRKDIKTGIMSENYFSTLKHVLLV